MTSAYVLTQISNPDEPSALVHDQAQRSILFTLQQLFVYLQSLDQMAQSTKPLTDSFHWDSEDLVVQHDAQELNRVLFSVIEEALQGTEHSDLVKSLYKGCFAYEMKCLVCGNVRGRPEDFLDLSVNVKGLKGLEEALREMRKPEVMTGGNQYDCEVCRGKVDAQRSCVVTSLPQILTISLNRFEFVPESEDRKKITSAFTFPLELPASELSPSSPDKYELFGVLIHRGTAHHGHYHVYLRDVLREGVWQPATDCGTQMDIAELETESKGGKKKGKKEVRFTDELSDEQALSIWEKIEENQDWKEVKPTRRRLKKRNPKPVPPPGPKAPMPELAPPSNSELLEGWFDFDDERVRAIRAEDLSAEFGGSSETAYILIYRKVEMDRMEQPMIPPYWAERISEMNDAIGEQRRIYEVMKREVAVIIQDKSLFASSDGLLRYSDEKTPYLSQGLKLSLTLDDTVSHLKQLIYAALNSSDFELIEALRLSHNYLHLLRSLDSIPDEETLEQAGIKHQSCFIPLQRGQIQGNCAWTDVGEGCEPIVLHVRQGKTDLSLPVNKCWTVDVVKRRVAALLGRSDSEISLNVHGNKGGLEAVSDYSATLSSLKWYHSMTIVCLENKAEGSNSPSEPTQMLEGQISVIVYDEEDQETTIQHYVSLNFTINRLITELKQVLKVDIPLECRLKRLVDNHYFTAEEANKRLLELDFAEGGVRLCLERGQAPPPGDIILKIMLNDSLFDVFLSPKSTISQL